MSPNLGGDEAGDRAAGVGVEIEPGSLAALEPEETCPRDHGRVVRSKPRARREYRRAVRLQSRAHCRCESAIARYSAAKHHPLASERIRGAPRFLDERLDQRVLKRARHVGSICVEIFGCAYGIEHCRLQPAE